MIDDPEGFQTEEEIWEEAQEEEKEYTPPDWLTPDFQLMRYLVREYYRAQAARIRSGNYIRRLEARGVEADRLATFFQDRKENTLWEGRRRREIEKRLTVFPIWTERLHLLTGIGVILAGGWLGELGPAERFHHASAVHKYCGLAIDPESGFTMKAMAGEKRAFSRKLKTLAWKTSKSFVMTDGPYRRFYVDRKRFEEERKDWNAMRLRQRRRLPEGAEVKGLQGYIDAKTKRWTVKLFLSHLWQRSREIAGLPAGKPWVIKYGGHDAFIEPPW